MRHYHAYIDESGDEGFGKLRDLSSRNGQSTWLVIGAIVVSEANGKQLPAWRNEIRDQFTEKKSPDLHWVNLRHEQRVVAAKALAAKKIGICVTLSHKVTIPGGKYDALFKQPQYLYNYMVRWLLERLIAACENVAKPDPATLHLTFSRRSGTDYQVMRDYLQLIKDGRDKIKTPRRTNWRDLDIDGIAVENHSKRAGLQLADCVTSAFFHAVEPNRYGNIEPAYATLLIPKLVSKSEGLSIAGGYNKCRPSDEQRAFLQACWKK